MMHSLRSAFHFRGATLCVIVVSLFTAGGMARAGMPAEGWHFDFGLKAGDSVTVPAGTAYLAERGYGFESQGAGVAGEHAVSMEQGGFVTAEQPFLFSAAVPEGNYRVTVVLGDPEGRSSATVKAESRRLMLEKVETEPGDFAKREFVVNVRHRNLPSPPQNAPGGTEVQLNDREVGHFNWDEKLTLEFSGAAPKVREIRIVSVDVPTVFLAGDSTVTDQRWEPGASWGQMLPAFFKPVVAVANHAESGETLKSFLTALRFDKILSQLRPGDYLFVQFGHNDSKAQWPQTYVEASTTYRAYLRVYIAEARRRGAIPVLVTSVQRRSWGPDGKIQNTHGGYPQAVRDVAAQEGVALIDLQAMSTVLYEALGPEQAPKAFSAGGSDATHHNNYGAYELAKCVVEGIRAAKLPLAAWLRDDVPAFDPARPDPVETFALPASAARSDVKPRGN